jgi:hypothetical protein
MKNRFTKGEKVFCKARIAWFIGNRRPMCGTIKYKLPNFLLFLAIFIISGSGRFDYGNDYYFVEMEDGKLILYHESSITELDEAIDIAEKCWELNEKFTNPESISAQKKLRWLYEDMKKYKLK